MANYFGDYSAEIDSATETRWAELLREFDDANIHQTWSEGAISWGERNLSHLVLRGDGEVIGMAQLSIRKLPIIGAGIATVYWGPMWRRKGRPTDYAVLDKVIEALKKEYVTKRGFLLRIWPIGFENSEEGTLSIDILGEYGFTRNSTAQPYRTLLLDLRPSLENVRKNLSQGWRKHLTRAERGTLKLIEGTGDELYEVVTSLYKETIARKRFISRIDINKSRAIQNELPDPLKMRIMICECANRPIAALVGSALGSTGIEFITATGKDGLELGGSYFLRWRMIEWLKEKGCCWYDLNGIDPEHNPGSYQFKMGLAGKSGRDVRHVGQFFLATNLASYFLNVCINRINTVRSKLRWGLNYFTKKDEEGLRGVRLSS